MQEYPHGAAQGPEAGYRTVDEFLADLERHLKSVPAKASSGLLSMRTLPFREAAWLMEGQSEDASTHGLKAKITQDLAATGGRH